MGFFSITLIFLRANVKIFTSDHVGISNVKDLFCILDLRTSTYVFTYIQKVKRFFYITNSYTVTCRDFLHRQAKKTLFFVKKTIE
jgi:hypothetical protein